MTTTTIELLGRNHAVTLPQFIEREELAVAYSEAEKRPGLGLLRVYAAAIGLCTRVGRLSSVDYAACHFDPSEYGGKIYGWLREQGVSPDDLAKAAIPVLTFVFESLMPREQEVKKSEDFS